MEYFSKTNLEADLFLIHAPSVYDFRERDDMLFAYLSDSDSVNVTPIYEMFPLGFFSIKSWLAERGLKAEIVNIASLMLMYPRLDVRKLLQRLHAPVYGFDLHWMAQCQGSIAVAEMLKTIHPSSTTIFGGLSATMYAEELIRYPGVDVVVKGYDTLEPIADIVTACKSGERSFGHIPNLVFKQFGSDVTRTGFSHKPRKEYNDATVDWSFYREVKGPITASKMIMTLPNSGCTHDCGWCGGSRYAFKNIMDTEYPLMHKPIHRVTDELRTMGNSASKTSIYALQCYSEPDPRMYEYLSVVKEMGYQRMFYEQYNLPSDELLTKMVDAAETYIMLSPESHDQEISRLAGRGNYSMAEMELWIEKAISIGVKGVMIWFFIGMPKQTPDSVLQTVAYSERLMEKFGNASVLALVCPMVPFLDPGSRFFDQADRHGYRIFHRTLEEHRRAMVEPLWYKRLNYETAWMSRKEIQDISYESARRLVIKKGELGFLPRSICERIVGRIDETAGLLREIEQSIEADGVLDRELRDVIRKYNREIFSHSTDQIVPVPRAFGGRWYDDFSVPRELIQEVEM